MKQLFILLTIAGIFLLNGCQGTKMAANDIEVQERFKNEIKTLNAPGGSNTREKYLAALVLAENLDFTYVRNIQTLFDVLGKRNAKIGMRFGQIKAVSFVFEYEKNSIIFNFPVTNKTVLNCELVRRKLKDSDKKKPEKVL